MDLLQISIEVGCVLIGQNRRLVWRHLAERMTKLCQKALIRKRRSRNSRTGSERALAGKAVTLITTDLDIEPFAVGHIAGQ